MTDISAAALEPTVEAPAPPPAANDVQLAQAPTNKYDAALAEMTTPSSPAAPVNKYDAAAGTLVEDRTQRLRATVLSAAGGTPEAAAKAATLARKTGMPADMVERNLPEVERADKLNKYDELLKRAPNTAAWLAQDPINIKVASADGDVEKLGFLEWTANELYRPYLGQQASSNLAGMKVATRKTVELEAALGRQTRGEYLTPFDKAMIRQEPEIRDAMRGYIIQYGTQREERLQEAAALPELPVIKEMQKAGEAGDWGGVFSAMIKDPVRAAYVISLQGAAMLPWQIAGYAVAGIPGAFASSFGLEYMGAVEDAMKASGVNTADPSQVVAAFGNPDLMAKVEKQAATKAAVIGAFDAASMKVASVPLGFGKRAVTKEATNIAAQIGVQGVMGGAGEAGGSVAAGLPVDPFAVVSEVIGEIGGAPMEVAGARWKHAIRQDATSEQWAKFQALAPLEQYATGQTLLLDKLVAQANDTKLATTSPEKLQEFMAGVSAQDATVFVPAETVMTYMQDMTGLQSEAFAARLGIGEQLARIAATGEDVAIPLAMYITGAREAHAAWRDQVRTEVDGFSVKQAQEWEKAKASELKALQDRFEEHVQAGTAPEPQAVVYQRVLEMAKANGYTNEVAAQHAALFAARYAARAARNPAQFADALDAYERAGPGTGVRIQTVLPDGTRAMGPDVLDAMLNSIRTGTDPVKLPKERKEAPPAVDATILKAARRLARGWTPEKAIPAPQSLTDFVRKNGGLRIDSSEAGDIRAADLAKIPGLLQLKGKGKGRSADLLAQAAKDAGFRFGQDTQFGSGVDVAAFLKALEGDATGRAKAYPDDAETAAFQAQQDYFNEFFRWLKDDIGWEPKGRTAEEVAKFLSQDDTTQRLMVLAERVDALGPDSAEARHLDRELERIANESLERLADEFAERDAALADNVDETERVPDTAGLSTEEWDRLHGDIAATISTEDTPVGDAGEGRPAGRDAQGVGGDQAGDRSAPVDPREAARARRAAALATFQANRRELADALTSMGLDIAKMSNAQVRDAIAKAAKEQAGARTLHQTSKDVFAFQKSLLEQARAIVDGTTLANQFTIEQVYLVGSRATGKERTGSDYDFVVRFDSALQGPEMADLWQRLSDHFDKIKTISVDGKEHPVDVFVTDELYDGRRAIASDGKTYNQEARGSITFADNQTTISLFQARDLSTLAHETGHLWLAELEHDVKQAGANDQVKADWQAVQSFLGSSGGYITREQHELFARSFETYLMEGKAPSEGLRGVFRSFKNWLVSIYRNLARLQAPISPEMREVFDRLIATDEEIAAARDTQGLNPVFADAKSAGMTDAEFAAYTRRVTQVVDEAEERVLEKTMASIRRQRTKEVATEKAKIRKEATDELMADPGQAALHLLRSGKLYAGETPETLAGAKLSRDALVAMLGQDGLKALPTGIYVAEGGIDPDVLAETVGLGNGQELVERLMQIQAEQDAMRAKGDNRSVASARIAEETQKRLTESLGDPLNDGSIEAEAMAAVHSDKQGALMSSELKVLARKAKQSGAITLDDIKTWAENTIAEMSVYQATQFAKYQRAERMAGQKVQRALIKGDFVAAFKAKQDQLVNFALYQEARKAAEDTESVRKLADRYASADTIKSMDQGALEQIHQLLEDYDFKKRSGTLLAERTTFAMWAAEQVAAGYEVIEPPRLKGAQSRHYSQMTMEEIRGLGDTIKQMAHIGRWKQSMIDDGKRRDFKALVDEAVAAAESVPQRGVSQMRRGTTRLQDVLGDVGSWFRSVDAALLKMETIFEWLDGDKTGKGVFSRVIFRRVADAQVQERDLQKRLAADAKAIFDKVPAEQSKLWSQHHVVEYLGAKLNKSQMIAVALNMGNESNMQKMLQGEKWAEPAVRAMLDKHLSKEEWQFVQDTWNLIESLWPQTEAMERRINGVAPPKVEALPVETPHGTLRGGYYPMAYDRAGDVKADRIAAMGGEGLFDPEYRRASTRAGSTHKRVEGFNAKVLLSLNVIGSHLNEVAHDLAFREVVMDAYKFLSNDRVREAIRSAVGPEYEKQTLVWLKAVANEWAIDRRGLEGVDKFLQTARANTAIVGMGFRVSTMLSQTAGFANSVQRLGSADMLRGLRDFYRNPFAMKEAVHEKSGEMRNRANDLERDIRLALKRMEGKDTALSNVRRFAFRGVALFDAAVSLPTWMGAYNKGLRDGMTEAEAVAYGDKMVRDTQGAGSVKDLSAFQRGSEPLKLLGMFYSYFNVYYNRQRGLVRDFRSADSFSDYMNVVTEAMWLMVVPTLLAALLSGQGPDDDEEWWAWASRNVGFGVFSGVPWARDIANAASNQVAGKNFGGAKLSPIQGIGEGTLHLFKDVANLVQGKETSKASIKNSFNVAGLFTGLPLGQVGASTQYVWDALVDGTQNPEGLLDWMKGLAYGPKPKK